MDIAQYIGLFLIKNEYCYLPGIGSLQIDKKPAVYNSETQQMNPHEYEVTFQKTAGSIDDSFANFIATNERISIAHAANFFKDYCTRIKSELKEGKDVIIPGIGKFFCNDNQLIQFATDPNLQIKGKSIPFFKISPTAEKSNGETISNIIDQTEIKEPRADEEIVMKAPQVNWTKIIVFALVALGIVALIAYFIFSSNSDNSIQPITEPATTTEMNTETALPIDVDTVQQQSAQAQAEPANNYLALINTYPSRNRAEKRIKQLQSYGHEVSLNTKDSSSYKVVMVIPSSIDTSHYLDSLSKLFGSKIHLVK